MAEDAAQKLSRAPFPKDPEEFNDDVRISYDQVTESYKLEDENGEEWEWLPRFSKWTQVMDEELVKKQQSQYAMPGVDENEPAMDARKKRKAAEEANVDAKKQKAEEKPAPKAKPSTAVYVTGLPDDTDEDEVFEVFRKCGLIAESVDDGKPRITLYKDDEGNLKGDAVIVYYRHESVGMAIQRFNNDDFRWDQPLPDNVKMRVTVAESTFKAQKEQPLKSAQAKTKGTGANRDRQKAIKKKEEMERRLADWDDDDDNPSAITQTSSRWDKIVVLKRMFTLEELAEDPAAEKEIKDDVREACEKYGTITNLILYDKELDGTITVRYATAEMAHAAARGLAGSTFGGRHIECYFSDGTEKFLKTRRNSDNDQEGEEERLKRFGEYIEAQVGEDGDGD